MVLTVAFLIEMTLDLSQMNACEQGLGNDLSVRFNHG